MPSPSNSLPSHWPQLSQWQIRAGEAPSPSPAVVNLTRVTNRLPEGHAVRLSVPTRRTGATSDAQDCRTEQADEYVRNVLIALLTPKAGCPAQRYASNAELRESVRTALALHPAGADELLEVRLRALGLPSLLRDEPQFMPGTLEALRYDVGVRRVEIIQSQPIDLASAGIRHLQSAGERDLSILNTRNARFTDASSVAREHAKILDFHYRAAGMEAIAGTRPAAHSGNDDGSTNRPLSSRRPAEFAAHLERCDAAINPRLRRKVLGRVPIYSKSQPSPSTNNCSIL